MVIDSNRSGKNDAELLAQRKAIAFLVQEQKAGFWPYFKGKDFSLEASSWAVICCRKEKKAVESFLKNLPARQNADGGFSNEGARLGSDWSTGLLVFALRVLYDCADLTDAEKKSLLNISKRAESWLLDNRAERYSAAGRFVLLLWKGPEYDYVRGWPWNEGTFDWIEPTAYALLALRKSEQKDAMRLKVMSSAEEYLLKYACKNGGWNFGDRNLYGVANPPDIQSTAVSLLALKSETLKNEAKILKAMKYLHEHKTASSQEMAWLAFILGFYGDSKAQALIENLIKVQDAGGTFNQNLHIHSIATIALDRNKGEILP
ncbi:MAG: hypothetical protein K2X27_25030 [Candidatus Obscuribacterales bacterium]|nr:hypothetical protein [Candidatus Obscuribacterales bacterium]